jgi:hypothetical protein
MERPQGQTESDCVVLKVSMVNQNNGRLTHDDKENPQ